MTDLLGFVYYLVCTHSGIVSDCSPFDNIDAVTFMDPSFNAHKPQRIAPHPVLVMVASNLLVRLGLLTILCLGAFYYFVTVMDQQQMYIGGHLAGTTRSNWLADHADSVESRIASGVVVATSRLSLSTILTGELGTVSEMETGEPEQVLSISGGGVLVSESLEAHAEEAVSTTPRPTRRELEGRLSVIGIVPTSRKHVC